MPGYYSVPTWMKQTQGTIEDVFNQLKAKGLVDRLMITDAEGNATHPPRAAAGCIAPLRGVVEWCASCVSRL